METLKLTLTITIEVDGARQLHNTVKDRMIAAILGNLPSAVGIGGDADDPDTVLFVCGADIEESK